VRFDCDTLAVAASFYPDRVVLELPQGPMTLLQTESASGVRYSSAKATFWNKGRDATLTIAGRTETCRERREPWQEATDRGVEFRAVGQEPGWFLEITGARLRFVYDYAEHELNARAPAPVVTDGVTTYDAVSGKHLLSVRVEKRPCNDVMSGELFPETVTVTLDKRTVHGCGRKLGAK
jgi:putative lipoprotein